MYVGQFDQIHAMSIDAYAITTDLNEGNINCCICRYVIMWQHQVAEGTFRELSEQGELFKDMLQKESYCQSNSRLPHHLSAKLYACGLMDKTTWQPMLHLMGNVNPDSR